MINIAKLTGVVTITDTDYDFLPVVKFTVFSGQSDSIEASGIYNNHYYWELNLTDIVQGYSGKSYVFFKNGDWNWDSILGSGGVYLDAIQSATNTTYPLGAWTSTGSMSSSSLISPATGLAKSYFNPSASYTATTNNNIVYFKINGDSYEIPLTKLQISGTNPANLTNTISLISTLLTS